eukprot:TRINITY_DN4042_c0_g1_i4.p2 TRINITY_DN4042_c0_g1~~TRINITY_DN4042_c0_g1_i4.p2  ORF type:complete len:124 (-),score=22.24 TRINITY_DN4042_c0_g1_i4:380-751(-)
MEAGAVSIDEGHPALHRCFQAVLAAPTVYERYNTASLADQPSRSMRLSIESLLEIGCSVGDMSALIVERFGLHLTGVDTRKDAILRARNRCPTVTFEVRDYSADMALPDSVFDAVLIQEAALD